MIANKNASAVSTQTVNWDAINWQQCEIVVRKLQVRIAKAVQAAKHGLVKSLQWLLTHSYAAKCLAVRKTVTNKGSKTPGVDGIVVNKPESRIALINSLKRRNYKPMPLKRIYIPKSNGKKRPLGIPTIKDRTMQALHEMSVSPISETKSDRNSYGFRPRRCCADAIEQLFIVLSKKTSPQWILEGDIKGCFDNISHQWMLDNIPMDKVILEKWLKAGFIETGKLFPTEKGTPQGGIISPVLSNFVLDGMEALLDKNIGTARPGIHLVRYADDFVITAKTCEMLENEIKPLIIAFLKERGLELSLEKTKITSILNGFDFLGQNVCKYPLIAGKTKLLIKPSKDNIKTFLNKIRHIIHKSRAIDQVTLINILNPKIRGWVNYHRSVVAKQIFNKIDHEIWCALWKWCLRRHHEKSRKWIREKYFQMHNNRKWCFNGIETLDHGVKMRKTLILAADTPIRRHTKIKGNANPYNPEMEQYFEIRESSKMRGNVKKMDTIHFLLNIQDNKCLCCGESITIKDKWLIHLFTGWTKGGSYTRTNNLCVLHEKCHKEGFKSGFVYVQPITPTRRN